MLRRLAPLVALALALTSCSGGGTDRADAFCEDFASVQDDLLNADGADPNAVADSLATVDDPPDEIAGAFENIVELYESMRDDTNALTDPENTIRFADLNGDITEVNDYIAADCGGDK